MSFSNNFIKSALIPTCFPFTIFSNGYQFGSTQNVMLPFEYKYSFSSFVKLIFLESNILNHLFLMFFFLNSFIEAKALLNICNKIGLFLVMPKCRSFFLPITNDVSIKSLIPRLSVI